MHRATDNGYFITLEGPEGGGKSTQAAALAEWLRGRGYNVLTTREPGGTPLGEDLRRVVTRDGPAAPSDLAELLIFGAARAQHLHDVIRPHLQLGGVVVCDRFADSTTAYQGHARGIDMQTVELVHRLVVGAHWPQLTLVLDVDARVAEGRRRERGVHDRFEREHAAFHDRVRAGYLAIARAAPDRVRVIDADGAVDEVQARIREVVDHAIA